MLFLQDQKRAALVRRTFQQRLNDPPILSFGPLPKQAAGGPLHGSGLALQSSALRAALPLNVHLLTLKALPHNSVLLRLAHLYQVSSLLWAMQATLRSWILCKVWLLPTETASLVLHP